MRLVCGGTAFEGRCYGALKRRNTRFAKRVSLSRFEAAFSLED